jgi:plastocyanin
MRKLSVILVLLFIIIFVDVAKTADISVDQRNKTFSQSSISLKVGDRLIFNNGDDVVHNITVEDNDGNQDDLGLQKPGEPLAEKFDKAGDYIARCQIHPRMRINIKVE